MHTPPPFNPVPERPRSKGNGGIILAVVGGIIILVCGGIVFAAFAVKDMVKNQIFPMAACMADMQSVSKASVEYAKAHDGRLPEAKNWQEDLLPFVEKYRASQKDDMGPIELMDLDGVWGSSGKTPTAFTLNDDVAGKIREDLIKAGNDSVFVFESTELVKNAHGKFVEPDKKKAPRLTGWLWCTVAGRMRSSAKGQTFDMNDLEDKASN